MFWYKHEIYKADIYSDCGQFRITGRRIAGNDFDPSRGDDDEVQA